MSIPGRDEAAALLLSLDPPAWHLRHSRAVAEVAAWLAARCEARRLPLDRRLVEAAALLHDVDKLLPATVRRDRRHGERGARWLAARGWQELAPAVAGHPVTRLADDAWYAAWRDAASLEERIVAYADKRAGQRLEPMAERFASWERRYPPRDDAGGRSGGWSRATMAAVRSRATTLEADVCAAAGTDPDAVRRLRWTGSALAAARRRAVAA
ncbi:MAG TPA: HD domain-containing protein [Candidatus Limnocylindrales bacterium]